MPVSLIFREGDSYWVTGAELEEKIKNSDAGVRSGASG